MKETFFEYLMVKCMDETHALDDDLPDMYESWIVEQDIEEIIEWADKWHIEQLNYLAKRERDLAGEVIGDLK